MVWAGSDARAADGGPDAVQLGPQHAQAALALATLTKPGPFGPRTLELGEYLGCFDESGALIAMAGERMHAGPLREISGVCTHPSHQGRGFARRLMLELVRRQLRRGQTPCLHVLRDNALARGLYARMGFRDHREAAIRVISLPA
jgi:predicted GNAT family acetyltransferase